MNTSNGSDGKTGIRSLGELAQNVPPPRDLWPAIAAEISQDAARAGMADKSGTNRISRTQWLALAAVIAALAVGMWIGRSVLPVKGAQAPPIAATTGSGAHDVVAAAYLKDPRYVKDRADLVRALDEKMKTLPPETQQKVTASLATIRKSIAEIQAALGRDPGNALLQELLVNSYQDEMRVLTTVHEADAGQEI
jgi:N-acyl-D-aspartate/D-glutamate deacylase